MLFINHFKNASAAKEYFAHLSRGDYFAKDAQEHRPTYEGKTAELLKLRGMEATKESFYSLCDNRHPVTGEKLTARDKDDRRIMTDMTFDVPKAVTQVALYDARVEKAVGDAIRETMKEVEADMSVRVRKGGKNEDRVSGNLMYVVWPHETTRPLDDGTVDPQKHRHVTVMNVSYDAEEERLKACQFGSIVRDKGYYQAAYHARLAHTLSEMGYGIKMDGHSFTLAGIDRDTVEKFSRRTAVIEAEAEKKNITDAAAKAQLGRKTREKKGDDTKSLSELRAEWDSRLTDAERVAICTAGSGLHKGDDAITAEQAKEYALEHSFQNASAVSEKRLRAEALTYAVGSVRPEDVADLAQHPEVIAQKRDGQLMTTTKTVLRDEVSMLQFAKDGQRKFKPFVDPDLLMKDAFTGLSEEQKKAGLHIVTSRDTVTGVVGKAGTGKTTMMRTTRDVLESETGLHVYAFAPSSQASRGVLAKEGFKDAETLAMLLKNEKLQEKTKGQILWIDEAGLVSARDMRQAMEIAKRNGNRVILSGDYTQHASVEAGDAFRLLEKEAGVRLARLTEIRRQTNPGYKKAVEAIAQGTGRAAQKGFDALDKMGCVVEASGEDRHKLLVADYLKAAEEGKSALIIAPTHSEGQKLTDALRGALKGQGALGAEHEFITRRATGWSGAQKGDARNYEPGMVVEFHQNAKGFTRGDKAVVTMGEDGLLLQKQDGSRAALPVTQSQHFEVYRTRDIAIAKGDRLRITRNGEAKVEGQAKGTRLNNGDIFTVEGFTKEGDIRLENGKLLPKNFGHFNLGYVDTSYASQGKTVDRVFIAAGNESLPASNQQQWYVSATRGREMAKIYLEDKQEVRDAIARTGQRLSAVELTHTKVHQSTWRERFAKAFERNRVTRFFKERAASIADNLRSRGREGLSRV
jgi:conjugative relaxase-like TrwC/TraI family protein